MCQALGRPAWLARFFKEGARNKHLPTLRVDSYCHKAGEGPQLGGRLIDTQDLGFNSCHPQSHAVANLRCISRRKWLLFTENWMLQLWKCLGEVSSWAPRDQLWPWGHDNMDKMLEDGTPAINQLEICPLWLIRTAREDPLAVCV